MFQSVSHWLENVGMVERPSTPPTEEDLENKQTSDVTDVISSEPHNTAEIDKNDESEKGQDQEDAIDAAMRTLDDVGEKAVSAAKEWGSYLYSFGKVAGQTVVSTAKDTAALLKDTVKDKTLIGDFTKEQTKFISDQKERKRNAEASIAPWVGYNEEEEMKTQILALSKDKRNFLRNPPSGIHFQFDFGAVHPVAMATLQEDPNLQTMRFDLVPQQISEEKFWRNYFYRVSLIKQSTQLSTLSHETGGEKSSGSSRRSSCDSLHKEKSLPQAVPAVGQTEVDLLPDSPTEHEFVSDGFADTHINEDDLRHGMKQLGVHDVDAKAKFQDEEEEDTPHWERELQKELADYELVAEGGVNEFDDEDIENEILQQIENETNTL